MFKDISEVLPEVVTWILLFSYHKQSAWVKWAIQYSDKFSMTNGTGQGRVSSPAMWGLEEKYSASAQAVEKFGDWLPYR